MYVLDGTVTTDGNSYGSKQLMIAKDTQLCEFDMSENGTVYLLVVNLDEERFIFWNFVNSDKEIIDQAKVNWNDQNHDAFPFVPGMSRNMFLFQKQF